MARRQSHAEVTTETPKSSRPTPPRRNVTARKRSLDATALGVGIIAFVGAVITAGVMLYNNINERQQKDAQFEQQALENEFKESVDRFASSTNPALRTNAVARMAEIAEKPRPDKPPALTNETYPYFERAAAQLASAVYMEEDAEVRSEVRRALERMIAFVRSSQAHALGRSLIDKLGNANRSARRVFIQTLAEYSAVFIPANDEKAKERVLDQLAEATAFCATPQATRLCLFKMMEEDWFPKPRAAYASMRAKWSEAKRREEDEQALNKLIRRAGQLIDAREVLAAALRGRDTPIRDTKQSLDLQWRFLAGADLRGAVLDNIDLRYADLLFTDLRRASLQRTHLGGIKTQQKAADGVPCTQFEGADWWNATFEVGPNGEYKDEILKGWLSEKYPQRALTSQ